MLSYNSSEDMSQCDRKQSLNTYNKVMVWAMIGITILIKLNCKWALIACTSDKTMDSRLSSSHVFRMSCQNHSDLKWTDISSALMIVEEHIASIANKWFPNYFHYQRKPKTKSYLTLCKHSSNDGMHAIVITKTGFAALPPIASSRQTRH